MAYDLLYERAAERALARLEARVRQRVVLRIVALRDDPRPYGAIKLVGREHYRIRVGDFRIIYAIRDERLIVVIIDVGDRKDVYRR